MSAPWGYQPEPTTGPPQFSGWWRRVGAAILDGLISVAFAIGPMGGLAVLLYFNIDDEDTFNLAINGLSIVYGLIFALIYYPLTMRREGVHNGQTWGKQACGIRVIKTDGLPMDANTAILREAAVKFLLFSTVLGCLIIPTILNYLWPLWDDRNQALHDKLANTFVVMADSPVPTAPRTWTWEPPVPPSGSGPVQWGS